MDFRIFIVEDDPVIAGTVQKHLRTWGCEAVTASDFTAVTAEFVRTDPHLVILDISLPFFNGYHWCQEIRKISKVPILFLSSASDNLNIVMAMNMGADDFIAKPFDLDVLTAKVQAMLRRAYDFAPHLGLMEHRGLMLNPSDSSCRYKDRDVELSKNEFRILKILMENRGSVVTREAIMTALWKSDCFVDENTLSVNIGRLRKKLESMGLPDFIKTKKGVGYLI
ncbi:MAG: response regulator transcription factor [Eubacteriales bacterium]